MCSHPQLIVSFFLYNIYFLSFPSCFYLSSGFITWFFPWLDLHIDLRFLPRTTPGSKGLSSSVQGQCPHRPRAGKRGQGSKPSFGRHPWWKDFHMCKSFRTKAADSVSTRFSGSASVQDIAGTTPCGTLLIIPIAFQLRENEHPKPPRRRRGNEEMSACILENQLREGQCLTRQPARGVPETPFASSRAVFLRLLLLLTSCTYSLLFSPPLLLCHSWLGIKGGGGEGTIVT